MAKRKSLLEDLADLITPMPKDLDPEAQDLGISAVLPDHDQQLEALAADVGRARTGGRLQMRAGINLDDDAYKGRRSSRSSLFPEEADGHLAGHVAHFANGNQKRAGKGLANGTAVRKRHRGEEEEGEKEEGEEEMSDDGMVDGLTSDDGGEGDEEDERESEEDEDVHEGDEGEEGSEEDKEGQERGGMDDDDDDVQALEAGYAQLQEEERRAVGAMKEKGKRDVVKGKAAKQQQVLYERTLEIRILLQKALAGSNRLPLPSTITYVTDLARMTAPPARQQKQQQSAVVAVAHDLSQHMHALRDAALSTLGQLMELHDALTNSPQSLCHSLVTPLPTPATPPTTIDKAWAALSDRSTSLASFRDTALDRWHSRAALSSGSSTLKGSLRALNQSVSKQVASLMQDPHKLIQRCRVAKGPGGVRHLGEPQPSTPGEDGDLSEEQGGYPSLGIPRDEETFDDGEFYQQLLKEFLEHGGAGSGGDGLGARPAKKRKVVDRRASKGRKIRYNVQDKLVNFMSAVPMEPPVFAEQLFANLFAATAGR